MSGDSVRLFPGEQEAIARRVAKGVDGVSEAMAAMACSRTYLLDALLKIAASPTVSLAVSLTAEMAIENAKRVATDVK